MCVCRVCLVRRICVQNIVFVQARGEATWETQNSTLSRDRNDGMQFGSELKRRQTA